MANDRFWQSCEARYEILNVLGLIGTCDFITINKGLFETFPNTNDVNCSCCL